MVRTTSGKSIADWRRRTIAAIIPPRKDAKIKLHGYAANGPLTRDEAIRTIRCIGRKQWKKEVGYHRRSLAVTAMFRIKCCFGGILKHRKLENQRAEARLRCKLLNHFTPPRTASVRMDLVNKALLRCESQLESPMPRQRPQYRCVPN